MPAEQTNLKCPKCGADILEDSKFCGTCGSDVSNIPKTQESSKSDNKCPKCGADLPEGTKFCGTCGSDVTATAKVVTAPPTNAQSYNTITVGGVRFNLPNGFFQTSKEDNQYRKSSGANVYKHIYQRKDEVVTIDVATYENAFVDDEFVRRNGERNGMSKTTINGVEVYMQEKTGNVTSYTLIYTQLNRYIVITSNCEAAKEFIAVNTAADFQNLPQAQYKTPPNKGKLLYGIAGLGVTLLLMYRSLIHHNNILVFIWIAILFIDFYYIYRAYKGSI